MKNYLILPCFNERKNIEQIIENISNILSQIREKYQIVVYDDGSNISTINILKRLKKNKNIRIFRSDKNLGKDLGILHIMKYCGRANYIIMDSDFQHPVNLLIEIIESSEKRDKNLIGKRINYEEQGIFRSVASKIYNYFILRDKNFFNISEYLLINKKNYKDFIKSYNKFKILRISITKQKNTEFFFYKIKKRKHGSSSFNIFKMLKTFILHFYISYRIPILIFSFFLIILLNINLPNLFLINYLLALIISLIEMKIFIRTKKSKKINEI